MPTLRALRAACASPLYLAGCLVPLLVVAALGVLQPATLSRLQDQLFDAYQRLAPSTYDPAVPVRIVDIDDKSLAAIGQWPWPRTTMAALVERLVQTKAAAVAFDMVFAEPDRTSPEAFLAAIPDAARRSVVAAALAEVTSHDARFAEAIAGAPAVLGVVLTQGRTSPKAADRLSSPPWGMAYAGDDPKAFAPGFSSAVMPLPELGEKATGLGALNWLPDGDQIVRRVPLLLRVPDGSGSARLVPSLALESLRVAQGASTFLVRASNASGSLHTGLGGAIESVKIGDFTMRTGPAGDVRLWFTRHRPERFISAADILDGSFDPASVAGRIVIVGSSSAGLTDIRATPLDAAMPGVEIQAQALETLLTQKQLVRTDWLVFEIAAGCLLALALAALLPLVPVAAGAVCAGSMLALVAGASWFAFLHHLLVDPLLPGAMVVAAYIGGTGVLFRAEQRGRRFVQNAFGRFVSPAVVTRLADDPKALVLGGELRPLTIMFTDVRNFSGIAERMDPRELTRFMNRYLSPMTAIVLDSGGTVDKYIGDAIMAFWNAPLADLDHAGNAVRAAMGMLAALPTLRAEMAAESGGTFPPIRCGIGLATGPCVVGNLGSNLRFDYSALGDDVNLSSRLEGMSKVYGVDILASEATVAAAPDFAWIELDVVVAMGRAGSTRIYTPLGDASYAATPIFVTLRNDHASMLDAYRARRFVSAQDAADRLRLVAPETLSSLYEIYAERCRGFLIDPPEPSWDGITRMARK